MSLFSHIWNTRNYRISFLLAVFLVLWLASGLLSSDTDSSSDSADESAQESLVRATIVESQPYTNTVVVRARTEPNRTVDMRAEVSGVVVDLPVKKGAFVEQGTVVCQLAVEDKEELLQRAKTQLKKAEIDYEGAKKLKSGNYQSQSEIAQASVDLEAARASYRRAELDLENIQIRAPFDGFIDDRPVQLGDLMQRGDICANLIDVDPLLVTGEVTEKAVPHIRLGDGVTAALPTGETIEGKVRFIERSADEVTRTFRVESETENADFALYSGLSAQLSVPVGEVTAHRISSSLLILSDTGELGIKILDNQDRVQFVVVELLADSGSGIWVTGLPERAKVITLGQQYVSEGEQVSVTLENSEQQTIESEKPSRQQDKSSQSQEQQQDDEQPDQQQQAAL